MNGFMILHLVIFGREADIRVLAPPHSAHDNFVVILEERAVHDKLLIHFTSLTKVNELALVMARLMSIVNIIRVLNQGAFTLD